MIVGKLDILFALDADSLVADEALKWMKVATQYLTSGISSRFSKYGVSTFSDKIINIIEYSDFQRHMLVSYMKIISDFTKHISIQPKPSVLINKLNGLIDVSMSTAAKIGLVLMDDDTDNDGDLKSYASEAWSKGLNLLSIGVGRHTDQLEMSTIAKTQTDYYLQLQDWEKLNTDGFSWAIRTFENCPYFFLQYVLCFELYFGIICTFLQCSFSVEPLHLYVTTTVPSITTEPSTASTPNTVVLEGILVIFIS